MERLRGEMGEDVVGGGRVHCRTTALPPRSERAVLSALTGPRYLWAAPDEPTIVGAGQARAVIASDGYDVDVLRDRITAVFDSIETDYEGGVETDVERHPAARPRMVGGLGFHGSVRPSAPWRDFPAAAFVVPAVTVTWAEDTMFVTVAVDATAPREEPAERLDSVANQLIELPEPADRPRGPGVERIHRQTSRDRWHQQVTRAVDRIHSGTLEKVVIAQSIRADLERPIDVPAVLERLGDAYPECHRFCFEPNGSATFFGATPERLVSVRGRRVETEALAGSTGRGDTDQEDAWLADELQQSRKDRHEHDLVTDAIVDQLRPFAESIHTNRRTVRRLATVQHLQTAIDAILREDRHVLELVEALHPTPAVGGLPPAAALQTIMASEAFDRGWYAGPIGWVDAAGDGSFAVGIRSAHATARRATLFAGAGIVADSDPDREWDEVQLKYRPILDALE